MRERGKVFLIQAIASGTETSNDPYSGIPFKLYRFIRVRFA